MSIGEGAQQDAMPPQFWRFPWVHHWRRGRRWAALLEKSVDAVSATHTDWENQGIGGAAAKIRS